MKKIIDLTATLGNEQVTLVPGHPSVEYSMIHTHEVNHRTNAKLSFSIHVGTHIDPPYHFNPKGKTIDELPLDFLVGEAYVARLRGKLNSGAMVSIGDIMDCGYTKEMLKDKFLIFDSGWSEHYGKEDYYTSGYCLDPELCQWLAEAGLRAVVLDFPPDPPATEEQMDGTESPAHRTLLGNNVCIVENCIHFEQIEKDLVDFYAIPLKIYKGCGGPARIFAIEQS